ncbi:fermentation/respiration switch protein [Photorhabdus luminescens subsp. luminescens]|uniref:Esterase FrsA n=1 Tax=Photorhabdus luminescens TaxID=29488 RepID=A0A1G5RIS2_PHOLU|nr:esterase FrsA [Photorhabdus luminescens]KMW73291.1 fermentation/respiration switch protein [Photorhabdus luminescens subsp. luminescens]SCZ73944.1 esterase FrsA [Photorhabdus luminescens]
MANQNLSESLFKPRQKHQETSTLVKHRHPRLIAGNYSTLDGNSHGSWYRMINRLMWIWRGIDPFEIEEVLCRIAMTNAQRSDDNLLDTVIGYRKGNWVFEWSHQAMLWRQKALRAEQSPEAGDFWLKAANLYSIAGYPHLKGDELSQQAVILANKAYENAARCSGYQLRKIEFKLKEGGYVTGFLHLPQQLQRPSPTILVCGSLDNLQSDYYRLFRDYLAPLGFAMLTVDMPSIGYSSRLRLTQDTCILHQQIIHQLDEIPWIDHTRIGLFGFRFGANVAVRLAYLESKRIKGVATLGAIVHEWLNSVERQQNSPSMYLDMFASRLGIYNVDENAFRLELGCYSLKKQGLLGRRCSVPMLAGYWQNDIFSPKEESKLIAMSSVDSKLLAIPTTPVYNSFNKALREISQWLKNKVC